MEVRIGPGAQRDRKKASQRRARSCRKKLSESLNGVVQRCERMSGISDDMDAVPELSMPYRFIPHNEKS
jgi:hypothetical protein